jgi:hypothetical protein
MTSKIDINAFAVRAHAMAFGEMQGDDDMQKVHSVQTLFDFVSKIKTVAYQAKLQGKKINLKDDLRIAGSGTTMPMVTDQEYNQSKSQLVDLTRSMRRAPAELYSAKTDKAMMGIIDRMERDVFKMASEEASQVIGEETRAVQLMKAADKNAAERTHQR